ncbi:MAG: BamA/TamA family outer membrane protein [Spirochaetia bacterium]
MKIDISFLHFLLAFLLTSIGSLPATEADPEHFYGRRIEGIEVRGNERSLDSTVLRISELEVGDIVREENVSGALLKLEKSDLFSEVAIHVEPESSEADSVCLVIYAEDKWTFIPVPFFMSDGESSMGGLVVVESNLFGTGKQIVTGGMAGSDGLFGFAAFVDPSFLQSSWRLNSSFNGGRRVNEIHTPDNKKALSFTDNTVGASLGFTYRFTDTLSAGFKTTMEQHEISDIQSPSDSMEEKSLREGIGESVLEISLLFNYDGTVPYGSLQQGFMFLSEASYVYEYHSPVVDGRLIFNIPSFADGRVRLLALGGYGERPLVSEKPISGQDGFRTLPFGKVSADDYWSLAAAYEWPVYTQSWGSLVFTTIFEHGWYRSSEVGDFFFSGPGAGFRIYLQRIAIPALGLNVAYNLREERTVFSVAIGMQM